MPPTPLYMQVRDRLRTRIASGDLRPGTILPSEFALADEMDVSQGTVRKALDLLVTDNLVERRQGRGTYVAETTAEQALFRFFKLEEAGGQPVIPSPVSEDVRERAAPDRIAERLGLAPDAPIVRVRRVRALGQSVAAFEDIFTDPARLPLHRHAGQLPNALYSHYQRAFSVSVARAQDYLTAQLAPPRVRKALELDEGTPVLCVRRDAFDLSDACVETRESFFVTDGLGYGVTLD
ncbi:GntR family transcriptional regulator [Pontivivens insulae]|uniref:HTH-type transcriptional repressor YvoA n=1 Tax=Pontivivens insulae TaxID=1639689 RepID=A0A2R8ABR6_9RHOB|nr:GntR family transcriptional regulator [Pontivivens insulae]RED11327.1 GntR family transcriptional regulator [Pontivivens insulae]SPF29500.1 HTH-type transcriptional repressor YvoA [Pontivivens insulae]